jgi:hypothetical protein
MTSQHGLPYPDPRPGDETEQTEPEFDGPSLLVIMLVIFLVIPALGVGLGLLVAYLEGRL